LTPSYYEDEDYPARPEIEFNLSLNEANDGLEMKNCGDLSKFGAMYS